MKVITLLFALFLLASCGEQNQRLAEKWVSTAKKPILCRRVESENANSEQCWTLVDANGNVYNTGFGYYNFPDTIKIQP